MTGRFTDRAARERFGEALGRAMEAWPPHETLDVPTTWGTTRVHHRPGTGKPVVLLHGAGVTSAMWADTVKAIERPVFAVDILGDAGGSVQTAPLKDMNAWLAEVLDRLGLADPLLVGISYGAWIAALHPVTESVLVEPAAGTFAPYRFRAIFYAVLAKLSHSERAWRRYLRWISNGEEPSDAAVIGLTHWRSGLPLPRRIRRTIEAKTVVIVGERSRAQDSRKLVARAKELPNARIVVTPGGHGLPANLADYLP
ncbi:alpha/beta fold hydrolase [Saccharothrix deserti]|uniref:alpha/beta fold hydrolase n=1 Tax=Saccharothrix deserti TaxID=2593674 RepID=UPI00131D266E|nr:alpha/beta hydrolase [Saccharothrix deserti]